MAHHVAVLIVVAKEAETPAERAIAEDRAVETVLKLWEHRAALPGQAYPLAQFKGILELLSKLTPDANPWQQQVLGERQQLASEIYNDLVHLTNLLLSQEAKSPHFTSAQTSRLLEGFLPAIEGDVYEVLIQRLGLTSDASEENEATDEASEAVVPALLELRRTIARTQTNLMSLLKALDSDVSGGAKSGSPIIDD